MRKILSTLLVALLSIVSSMSAHSESRGAMTLGIGGGYTTANHSAYSDIYFRYAFSSHVRIAPDAGYAFKHEGLSSFNFNIDMQFPFRVTRGIGIYPLAGVAFNNWNTEGGGTHARFGLNAGAGIDLKFTRTLRLTLIGKYTFMHHTDGAYIGAGIGYNF